MKIARDNKEFCAAILTDLSKAFDCICHNCLIAKLNAYGFDRNALKLICDYLSDISQKTKVGSSFSVYLDRPLLFDMDLCDLFFEDYSSDISNFANDTTHCDCGPTFNEVMNNLKTTAEKMFEWFSFNNLKANVSKGHLFLSPYQPVPVNIKNPIIESSNCEKLFGIYIDSNFSFEYPINRICRKASQKLHALSKIAKYISEDKKRMLFKSFIISQFNYCPIVWMCHGRGLNNKINNIHQRALRIVYQDKNQFRNFIKT